MNLSRFARYAWAVLAYNVAVVLWGAYVRATGSGAGCGSHWPLCGGVVIPRSPAMETMIEFSHRASSGVTLVLILGLVIWAYRAYPKGSPVRLGAILSGVFVITEALVGAGLVLFKFVAQNAAALPTAVHLTNTFLLLAALALTAHWASGGKKLQLYDQGNRSWLLGLGLLGVLALGVTGAITALGDTLFPSSSLAEGFQQDFAATSSFLIRLRVLHPAIAVSVGIYVVVIARALTSGQASAQSQRLVPFLTALVVIQLLAGALNVALMAPVWMQLFHLLLADLVWITMVLLSAALLAESASPHRVPAQPLPAAGHRAPS